MQSKNVWSYINIGTGFRYLQEATATRSIHGKGLVLENIERFLGSLDLLELQVTKKASKELFKFRDKLKERPLGEKLTETDARELKTIIKTLRPTFTAEAQCQQIYVVTAKRLQTEKLLGDVGDFFASNVFEKLTDIAKIDLTEAGRCIAFERPTAAAFHLMRATESIVFLYYKKYIRPAKQGLAWGPMTTALRQKPSGKKPASDTLAHLDHIRTAFRNPTQHPEKIYSIDEAQDLFFLCIDAINRVIAEIQ